MSRYYPKQKMGKHYCGIPVGRIALSYYLQSTGPFNGI